MSYMIQKLRPIVDRTKSCSCTLMSVTGVAGKLSWNDCQLTPSSNEMNMPNSVPAYSSPSRSGSSRTTRTGWSFGMPLSPGVMRVQLCP